MKLKPYYDFREEVVGSLTRDLIGPPNEIGLEHIIEDDPINQYIVGVLYPQSGTLDPRLDIDLAEDGDAESLPDPPVSLANVKYPSSLGLTFAVDSQRCRSITLDCSAARYQLISKGNEDEAVEESWKKKSRQRGGATNRRWKREAVRLDPLQVDLTAPTNGEYRLTQDPGLQIFYRVRRADQNRHVAVTIVLLNAIRYDYSSSETGLRDADSFFQPEIRISAPDSPHAAFVERPITASMGNDEDIKAYRLLYGHAREFAAGHGCSVDWDISEDEPDRAVSVRTTFAPQYALRLAQSNPAIEGDALGMKFLAVNDRIAVMAELVRFCDDYRTWIQELESRKDTLNSELRRVAEAHIKGCRVAEHRMRTGVNILKSDDAVWKAFRLMNKAMLSQLARGIWLKNSKPSEKPIEDETLKWHPFQLAFILLCLKGLSHSDSSERNLADLLWFPTGGGKTEAYLGLIAFTVLLRRLRHSRNGGGVTALMRYTLRLLTLQQFQRATLLICALEHLRQDAEELGREPISIGMWVGQQATPNTRKQAEESLKRLNTVPTIEEKNPIQLQSCPWCGKPLSRRNYWLATDRPRLVVACRNDECDFSEGLPVYVVDEDIYDYRPTLIISTVDKFAGLPWREESANLFNRNTLNAAEQLPPELIIQDELHLISGPLGTLTGLYETAVDLLCTHNGIPPKVIASTATIRRASQQSIGLFNREVRQFPPPGLDARDSYFAVEASPDEKGTRLYLGLMAPGTSHTSLMTRTYAALLQSIKDIAATDEIRDPYWTLVAYFNSLRVLGGARMQVNDDVEEWIARLSQLSGTPARAVENLIELTSREQSGKISEYLKLLAVGLPDLSSPDVVLATNMISVGVDIDRLGLMTVMGQPQSTSEYIQATSRVGRKYPGLVVILFNAAKSRDRSHYESFVAFHSAIYRQVESTTVTPFSARARDRGLHAVLVALARLLLPAFRGNSGAAAIIEEKESLRLIADLIVNRVKQVAPSEADATAAQLKDIIEEWHDRAQTRPDNFVYNKKNGNALLVAAGDESGDDSGGEQEGFPTLWSLRDVDMESNMYLVRLEGS